ncbi:MAG: hypothetical protein RI894_201 [Bacteroidota bacterium]|jgi:uncharacterized protein YfeS
MNYQTKPTDEDLAVYDPDFAHPQAVELMPEPYFWNPDDDFSPLGSDEGFEAYAKFYEWRMKNRLEPILPYLQGIVSRNEEFYTEDMCSDAEIALMIENSEDEEMYELDRAIIAVCFTQIIEEGALDKTAFPLLQRVIFRQAKYGATMHGVISKEHAEEYVECMLLLARVVSQLKTIDIPFITE